MRERVKEGSSGNVPRGMYSEESSSQRRKKREPSLRRHIRKSPQGAISTTFPASMVTGSLSGVKVSYSSKLPSM